MTDTNSPTPKVDRDYFNQVCTVCGVPPAIHELAHSLPTPPQGELEQNKLAKFYFTACSDGNGVIDWNKVDGSGDMSIIPTNSKGNILMTVGDLRTMIHEISKYFTDNVGLNANPRIAFRKVILQEVLNAIEDMDRAYPEIGRKVSRGEIVKWLQSELGTGDGRHG